jgi:heme/copper-type cytochrome/quinol oxidase subunit 4
MNLREIGCEGVYWMHLAQDKDQSWDLVNTITNFQVP